MSEPTRIDEFAQRRPDLVLMAPMLVYLALLALKGWLGPDNYWLTAIMRGVGGVVVVWIFRKHLPPWGKPHLLLAMGCALLIAAGWYYGQFFFNSIGVPHRIPLPMFPGDPTWEHPRDVLAREGGFWTGLLGIDAVFWMDVTTRILVASTTVAVVEELFWRAFLLRAMISWDDFEKIPLGTFTWFSFLGTSLISCIEHPDNWAVSIPCWFAFNALMYWKKSILFLVYVHGFTNLFLYLWVVYQGHWAGNTAAWMHW